MFFPLSLDKHCIKLREINRIGLKLDMAVILFQKTSWLTVTSLKNVFSDTEGKTLNLMESLKLEGFVALLTNKP
jgi:hypothetical protein